MLARELDGIVGFQEDGPPSLTGRAERPGRRRASEATTGAAQAAARNARRVGRLVIRGLQRRA